MKDIIKVTDKNKDCISKRRILVNKIVSYGEMGCGWDTKIRLVDGTEIFVKETAEQIDGLIEGRINECDVEF